MSSYQIIGNGSLIWLPSLHRTCPDAKIIRPVRVDGWRRTWTLPVALGDPAPTVINARPDKSCWFNGVLIEVPAHNYQALCAREHQYEPIAVDWRSWRGVATGSAMLWSSVNPDANPDWSHWRQRRYAGICLRGCYDFGDDFLAAFLATTWIGEARLVDLRAMVPVLDRWVDDPPEVKDP